MSGITAHLSCCSLLRKLELGVQDRKLLAQVTSTPRISVLKLCRNNLSETFSRPRRDFRAGTQRGQAALYPALYNLRHNGRATGSGCTLCKSLAEDSEGATIDAEDPASAAERLKSLKEELERAVASENYTYAAQLRDKLKIIEDENETGVLAANLKFYRAFENADVRTMRRCWARGDHVQCVHPASNMIAGSDLVMASWEMVLDGIRDCKISLEDVRVQVAGDLGIVTCVEVVRTPMSSGRLVATNAFEKTGGEWLMILHHASPAPALRG